MSVCARRSEVQRRAAQAAARALARPVAAAVAAAVTVAAAVPVAAALAALCRVSAGALAVALSGAAAVPAAAGAEPPRRVVSMNLCTDQLALMLAAPGQLVSVSYLAQDPAASPLAEAARAVPGNRGLAEDIVLLRPDLVLAGRFSATATVAMLERLGVPVVRFEPEDSLDDVEANLHRMGEVLGQPARAAALVAEFRAGRAALAARVAAIPPARAAIWQARGWSPGRVSLAGDILAAAGLHNIAGDLGLTWGGVLALETLLLAAPEVLVLGGSGYGAGEGHSQARALLSHPALRGLPAHARGVALTDRDWICGTPHVLAAVGRLIGRHPDPGPD